VDAPRSNPLDLLVRQLRLHIPLADEDAAEILALPYKLRALEAQSYTLREGEKPDRCAILIRGFAYRHKVTGDGSRQILSLHIPGDALDFQNMFLEESDHNVQMLTRGEVAEIARPHLEELVQSRARIGEAILIASLVESSIFREWTLNVGRRDSRSRIAHLLCEFAYRLHAQGLAKGSVYELPMTQEQLADATGLTPVHVNRVLKGLQSEGLIERDRRMISIPSWEKLRDVGDFSPRYLHVRTVVPD
jgi:CRP-like cAMP-binding protein